MTGREALAAAVGRLRAAGVPGAERDARRLLAHAAGIAPARLAVGLGDPLPPAAIRRFETAVRARQARRPVAQITGTREFWGRAFAVTSDVLDPRPETETLIAAALAGGPAERIVDLGTGSGCIGLTLLCEWPRAGAICTDASPAALSVACGTARALGVAARARFVVADWWAGVGGGFDLIVSNPPYIGAAELAGLAPELAWEPRGALSPGADPLAAYRAILAGAAERLRPGGRLLLEVGAGQADAVGALAAQAGLAEVGVHADMDDRPRVVEARAATTRPTAAANPGTAPERAS